MIFSFSPDLLLVLFFLLLCIGIGEKILQDCLGFEFSDRWIGLLISLGAGLAFFTYATFIIGFLGGLYRWVFILLLAASLIWEWPNFKNTIQTLLKAPALIKNSLAGRYEILLFSLLILACMSNLIFNYSPPTQTREMMYDLTLPKLFLQKHKIVDINDQLVFYYPQQIQMLYLLLMTVKGVLAAKLLHYSLGLGSLCLVYFLSKDLFGNRTAWTSALIFYLMPVITSLSGTANIDLGALYYGLLVMICFHLWTKEKKASFLYLAGFFCGASLGCKVTSLSIPLTLAGLFVAWSIFKFKTPAGIIIKKMIVTGLFCILAVSPWAFRNAWFTGNPAAPFSIPRLGWKGHEETSANLDAIHEIEKNLGVRDYLRGFHNVFYGDFIYGPGPLVFAFLLPAFLYFTGKTEKPDTSGPLGVFSFAALNYTFLFLLLPYPHKFYESRYYIVSISLFALISGSGITAVMESPWKKSILRTLVVFCLIFPCLTFSLLCGFEHIQLFLGLESRENYLQRKLIFYPVVAFANKCIPADAKVVMIGSSDSHAFYWKARTILPRMELLKKKDKESVISEMKKDGITHVLYFKNFYSPSQDGTYLRHAENKDYDLYWNMNALTAGSLIQIYSDKDVTLYRIQ